MGGCRWGWGGGSCGYDGVGLLAYHSVAKQRIQICRSNHRKYRQHLCVNEIKWRVVVKLGGCEGRGVKRLTRLNSEYVVRRCLCGYG